MFITYINYDSLYHHFMHDIRGPGWCPWNFLFGLERDFETFLSPIQLRFDRNLNFLTHLPPLDIRWPALNFSSSTPPTRSSVHTIYFLPVVVLDFTIQFRGDIALAIMSETQELTFKDVAGHNSKKVRFSPFSVVNQS